MLYFSRFLLPLIALFYFIACGVESEASELPQQNRKSSLLGREIWEVDLRKFGTADNTGYLTLHLYNKAISLFSLLPDFHLSMGDKDDPLERNKYPIPKALFHNGSICVLKADSHERPIRWIPDPYIHSILVLAHKDSLRGNIVKTLRTGSLEDSPIGTVKLVIRERPSGYSLVKVRLYKNRKVLERFLTMYPFESGVNFPIDLFEQINECTEMSPNIVDYVPPII